MDKKTDAKVVNLFSHKNKQSLKKTHYSTYINQLNNSQIAPEVDYLIKEIQSSDMTIDLLNKSLTLLTNISSRMKSSKAVISLDEMRRKLEDKVIVVDF